MEDILRIPTPEAVRAAERAAVELSRHPSVKLVLLFGSAADVGREVVRDVDLAVLTDPPLTMNELLQIRADLVLATGVSIDLVSLNDASVVLAWEVAETGRCLYSRDADAETEFVTSARARYWDFKPYLDEQRRLAAERLEKRRGTPA